MITLDLTFWGPAKHFFLWLHHFTFPVAINEYSDFSTSSSTLVIAEFWMNKQTSKCVCVCIILMGMKWYVIIGFALYFPNSQWCWASLHVFILPLVSLTSVQYNCWVLSVLYIFCDKKVKVKVTSNSLRPHGLYSPWNSPGQNTRVVSLSLLQGIFPTQGSNPGLPHCKWVLYQLSHKRSPRILEWVAYSLLQGIFPTQELNQGLLRCRQILQLLSYKGSPKK